MTCFIGWGFADVVAMILSHKRLEDRKAKDAIEQWERQRSSEDQL